MIGRTEIDLPRCNFFLQKRGTSVDAPGRFITGHSQSFIPTWGDQTVASNETQQFAKGQSALMVATVPKNLTFA